jgi:hypothetical protein
MTTTQGRPIVVLCPSCDQPIAQLAVRREIIGDPETDHPDEITVNFDLLWPGGAGSVESAADPNPRDVEFGGDVTVLGVKMHAGERWRLKCRSPQCRYDGVHSRMALVGLYRDSVLAGQRIVRLTE